MDKSESSNPPSELNEKLKKCDPQIQNLVATLKAEKLKLQTQVNKLEIEIFSITTQNTENMKLLKQNVKLQINNKTLNNRVKILEKEALEPKINVNVVKRYDTHNNS